MEPLMNLLARIASNPLKTEYLMSAALIASLASLVCFYAAKYELATLGVSTGAGWGWWPPRRWESVQIWRAVRRVEEPKARLWFWAIMMWVYWLMAVVLLPFVLYIVYKSLTT